MKIQKKKSKSYEIDMCNGPLFSKILLFSIPLMLSGILQLCFNAADIIVVGRVTGNHAMAAVGSTAPLIDMLVNLFIGLSVGINVMVAKYYGAKEEEEIQKTVHTAVSVAVIAGVILTVIGIVLAKPLLHLMKTPMDVMEHSVLYMRIYFLGMVGMLVYNFASAVLRGVGDTRRPLYILLAAGSLNVILNMLFVIVFDMGVAGVATATVISQLLSACLVVYCLIKSDSCYHLNVKALRIEPEKLKEMAWIGIPAGLQGMLFSLSNILIQSSVNSFGSTVMAGNTAAVNIEGFASVALYALQSVALNVTSQNYGAHQYKRIMKALYICLGMACVIGLILGNGAFGTAKWLLRIYSEDTEVIAYGMLRLSITGTTFFVCGLMDVMSGVMRGLGYSVGDMIVSLIGICGIRGVWIFSIFAMLPKLEVLFISYPVTWTITLLVYVVWFMMAKRILLRE